jgi:hypothetical protein
MCILTPTLASPLGSQIVGFARYLKDAKLLRSKLLTSAPVQTHQKSSPGLAPQHCGLPPQPPAPMVPNNLGLIYIPES